MTEEGDYMFILRHISKIYDDASTPTEALKDVSLVFERAGLVALCGPSGSGKTTLLNIIGGLDHQTKATKDFDKSYLHYPEGEFIVSGVLTDNFDEDDWDTYRNERIGFVFQNLNLLAHLSVLENVELGMILAGEEAPARREKALEALKQVGIADFAETTSAQLSFGQKQRVAIARALANDPDVILADEPIGSLDTQTGREIMVLLKRIAEKKLVIMASHNEAVVEEFADRIVRIKDGEVQSDTTKHDTERVKGRKHLQQRTTIPFLSAAVLSFRGFRAKLLRNVLAMVATGLGVAGLALVMGIAIGFSGELRKIERDTLTTLPVSIYQNPAHTPYVAAAYSAAPIRDDSLWFNPIEFTRSRSVRANNINDAFLNHLDGLYDSLISGISYRYGVSMPFMRDSGGTLVDSDAFGIRLQPLADNTPYLQSQFEVRAGRYPENDREVVIIVDIENNIDSAILSFFGLEEEEVAFEDVLGKELVVVFNDDMDIDFDIAENRFNREMGAPAYENGIVLTLVGVLKGIPSGVETMTTGLFYPDTLEEAYIAENIESDFCKAIMDLDLFDIESVETRSNIVYQRRLNGCRDTPNVIDIFPSSLDDKTWVLHHLNVYNWNVSETNQIAYTDHAAVLSSFLGSVSNNVLFTLLALGVISLVVSLMMVVVLVYIGLLERRREIGILRSLGASRKAINRVLNIEVAMAGFVAATLGIAAAALLSWPLNVLLRGALIGFGDIVQVRFLPSVALIVVTTLLTYGVSIIPTRKVTDVSPADIIRGAE